jgi:hypothetical protein
MLELTTTATAAGLLISSVGGGRLRQVNNANLFVQRRVDTANPANFNNELHASARTGCRNCHATHASINQSNSLRGLCHSLDNNSHSTFFVRRPANQSLQSDVSNLVSICAVVVFVMGGAPRWAELDGPHARATRGRRRRPSDGCSRASSPRKRDRVK